MILAFEVQLGLAGTYGHDRGELGVGYVPAVIRSTELEAVADGQHSLFLCVDLGGNLVAIFPARGAGLEAASVIGAQDEKFALAVDNLDRRVAVTFESLTLLGAIAVDAYDVAFLVAPEVGNLGRTKVAANQHLMLYSALFDVAALDQ